MAYTKKTWKDFPNASTPITAEDLQKIEDGIEALDTGKVNKTDIVDNLTTNDATKVLSAKQGKVLNEMFTYSTEEQVVGKWIDGKTIYRKVILFRPTSIKGTYNHGITGIAEILPMSCANFRRTGGQYVQMSFYYPASSFEASNLWSMGWQAKTTAIEYWIGQNMVDQMVASGHGVVVVLYYTKS